MNNLQLYAYFAGIITFFIGCFFYYLSKKKYISEKQKLVRGRIMNFFLLIGFICVIYSWF